MPAPRLLRPDDLPGLKTEDGIADLGEFRAAWFRHSEGNTITLAQLAEPPFLYSP